MTASLFQLRGSHHGAALRPRVLLVDDDAVFLRLTSVALRHAGFEVETAAGGLAAFRALERLTPDVLVLDALMPDLDGFEVCRRLRQQPAHEHLPVLMMTGLDDDPSIAQAYEVGATDFLVKTTQYNLLVGRLRYMLRGADTRSELERNKARLARAQTLARMGSCSWVASRGLADVQFVLSPEGREVLNFAPDERATVKRVLQRVQPSDRRGLLRLLCSAAERREALSVDLGVTLPSGSRRVVHLDAEAERVDAQSGVHYTGVIQDFTDRRQAEDRIRDLADFDPLTDLPNRRQILWRAEQALQAALARGHMMAMLLVDLDRFKIINDTLGHAAGDELLVEVARRLRHCVRHVDKLHEGVLQATHPRSHRQFEAVGRLGGDEFVALLPEIGSSEDAQRVAQRMLESLRQPVVLGGQECFVTASIGLCLFPQEGDSVADLLRNADIAMYAVKAQGRNAAAAYTPSLSRRARERLELESALHKAVERRELFMRYQPCIDSLSSRIVGAEALMRWRRGDREVMPSEFISVAEESGLIVPMTEWALEEVSRQVARWQDRLGFDGSVAVNMPARMVSRPDVLDLIRGMAERARIDPARLHLEITETTLMDQVEQVVEILQGLREVGIQISIDDFGTGYSSLAYLTRHPISELKIDRGFVKNLGEETRANAVVAAVIAMARALELRVVAEGVETRSQMEILQLLGCRRMQGYYFAHPLDPQDFEGFYSAIQGRPEGPWQAQD